MHSRCTTRWVLDMNLAGIPPGEYCERQPCPIANPMAVNVGRKGIVAFADLTALPGAPTTAQIDKIVGARICDDRPEYHLG